MTPGTPQAGPSGDGLALRNHQCPFLTVGHWASPLSSQKHPGPGWEELRELV